MFRTAKVAVDKAAYHFDLLFDYLIPAHLEDRVQPGCRVLVPFGGGNRTRQGVVLALGETTGNEALKPLHGLLDETPILTDEMIHTLGLAAKRGVDVRIIVPHIPDKRFVII